MTGVTAVALTPTDQELKYMPNGWTVFSALYELFGLARPRCLSTPADGGHIWDGTNADYVSLARIDYIQARLALRLLPTLALKDRQNRAPELGSLLRACAASEGDIWLQGYLIGPARSDERLSVDGIFIAQDERGPWQVDTFHTAACQCQGLWAYLQGELGLDGAMPDEIIWHEMDATGAQGWWLWWD